MLLNEKKTHLTENKGTGYVLATGFTQALVIFCILITVFSGIVRDNPLRYAVYIVPFLFFLECFINPDLTQKIDKKALGLFSFMLLLFIYPAYNYHGEGVNNLVFTLLPFLALTVPVKVEFKWLKILTILLCLGQIILTIHGGFSFHKLLHANILEHTFKTQSHSIPFIIGLLLVPLYLKKEKSLIALCLFCLLIGEKRIVILGAIVGGIALFASKLLPLINKHRGFVFVILVSVTMVINIFLPDIYSFIAKYYGLDVHAFTSGRFVAQSYAYEKLFTRDTFDLLFGSGLGYADYRAGLGWGYQGPQIHNDYLRLLLDMGFVSGILFVLCLIRIVKKGPYAPYLFPYIITLWFTDNTLIYAFFGLVLSLLVMEQRDAPSRSPKEPLLKKESLP